MATEFIFHNTCYDQELLRKQKIILDEAGIAYQVNIKEYNRHARAPLSNFVEVEIHIAKVDFEKADELLRGLLEQYE